MEAESFLSRIAASEVKKGWYILLDEKTCKITDLSIAKTGKHGHMKVNMTGVCIFRGTKHCFMCAGHTGVLKVDVEKRKVMCAGVHKKDNIMLLDYFNEDCSIETIEVNEDIFKLAVDQEISIVLTKAIEGKEGNYIIVEKITDTEALKH